PDGRQGIITSTEALAVSEIPKHLVIIGGGIIGVELGSVYLRLGSKVTVVEFLDRIVPSMDEEISKELLRILRKQGMEFMLSTKVTGVKSKGKEVIVSAEGKGSDKL